MSDHDPPGQRTALMPAASKAIDNPGIVRDHVVPGGEIHAQNHIADGNAITRRVHGDSGIRRYIGGDCDRDGDGFGAVPEVTETVIVYVPTVAVALAVKVSVYT